MSDPAQLKAQREAMEKSRFGFTKKEIIAAKGRNCYICGQPVSDADMVIAHKQGGGRHATETGMMIDGKTHAMDNLAIAHRACEGKRDRLRGSMGMGIEGNANNPSQ